MENYKEYLEERMSNVIALYNESIVYESYCLLEASNKKVSLDDLKNDAFLTYLRQEHKKSKKEIETIKNAKEKDADEIIKKYKKYYRKYKVDKFVKKVGPMIVI